jgi:hypothetical protein
MGITAGGSSDEHAVTDAFGMYLSEDASAPGQWLSGRRQVLMNEIGTYGGLF